MFRNMPEIYIGNIDDNRQKNKNSELYKNNFYAIYLFESTEDASLCYPAHKVSGNEKYILFAVQNSINYCCEYGQLKGKVMFFTESFFCSDVVRSSFLYQTTIFNTPEHLSFLLLKKRYEDISILFKTIENELKNEDTETRSQIVANYLFNILLIGSELKGSERISWKHDDKLGLITDFKKAVFKENSKNRFVKYYTDCLNVTISSLEKAFKKYEHTTPKKWLINIIMNELKQKLRFSTQSISELSYDYGFNDISNFTKFFKKNAGITPTEFRNDSLKKEVTLKTDKSYGTKL